jgi:hypothetical protein
MVGAGIDDLRTGRQRTTSDYLSIWAQNTIGGAAIGASIDVGLASGGLAVSASSALGAAGYEALTVGGEGKAWSQLGKDAGTAAAIGAVAGPVLSKAAPFIGAAVGKIPGANAAGRWIAGKVGAVAEGVASRYVRTEADELLAQPFTQVLESASQLPTKARQAVGQLMQRAGQGQGIGSDATQTAVKAAIEGGPRALPRVAGGSQAADLASDTAGSTSSTFSVGRTHLSDGELGELMARPDMKVTNLTGAGGARPPRHHIFVQEQRDWFQARGVDIDKYTLELTWGEHSAAHTGGWNPRVKEFIGDEGLLGRQYTRREILKFGADLRREFGFRSIKVTPFDR